MGEERLAVPHPLDESMATVATRRKKKPCPTKKQKNRLDSDRPSHGRPCHQRALFIRLFWGLSDMAIFSPNCTGPVLSNPENNRLFIAFHFPGLKEAKNAEAYRAIAAGCVPNDD